LKQRPCGAHRTSVTVEAIIAAVGPVQLLVIAEPPTVAEARTTPPRAQATELANQAPSEWPTT
jgi:hypothetical protein